MKIREAATATSTLERRADFFMVEIVGRDASLGSWSLHQMVSNFSRIGGDYWRCDAALYAVRCTRFVLCSLRSDSPVRSRDSAPVRIVPHARAAAKRVRPAILRKRFPTQYEELQAF